MFIALTNALTSKRVLVNTDHIHAIFVDTGFTGHTVVRTGSVILYVSEPYDVVETWVFSATNKDKETI